MPGTLHGNDQSESLIGRARGFLAASWNNFLHLLPIDFEGAPRPWTKYYVYLAGVTNGAHHDFMELFSGHDHTQASFPEESDYVLIFYPIVSGVSMDINEALVDIPVGKPTILVVMHHTFNPKHVVAESRRLVDNPNIHLILDCLYHENKFLECKRNKTAWMEAEKFLAQNSPSHDKKSAVSAVIIFGVLAVVMIVTIISIELSTK